MKNLYLYRDFLVLVSDSCTRKLIEIYFYPYFSNHFFISFSHCLVFKASYLSNSHRWSPFKMIRMEEKW